MRRFVLGALGAAVLAAGLLGWRVASLQESLGAERQAAEQLRATVADQRSAIEGLVDEYAKQDRLLAERERERARLGRESRALRQRLGQALAADEGCAHIAVPEPVARVLRGAAGGAHGDPADGAAGAPGAADTGAGVGGPDLGGSRPLGTGDSGGRSGL